MMTETRYGERFRRKRLSRRWVLKGATLSGTGLAAAAIIGCGREEQPAAPVTREPRRGGIINHAGGPAGSWDTRGSTFDPHVNSPTITMGYRLFAQGLLGYDLRTFDVEPELAQRWEQPSQIEYLFTLQPSVKWQNKPPVNGRSLTVDDIVFSLNRARSPDPQYQHRSLFVTVDKIEAIDKTTARITTKTPDATLLSNLSGDGLLTLAPEVVERAGRFTTPDMAIGTGPFVVRSIEENVGAEYVRNPDYWKPGRPYLDEVRTRHFENEQPAYAAFLAGQLDIARLPGTEVKNYIARQGPGYAPDWHKDMTFNFATPNVTARPMDDVRVTRALRLLIDHDEFKTAWAEVWFGRGRHASILPTGLEAWDLAEEEYARQIFWKQPKDEAVREALQLLSAAGFTRENPLRFELSVLQSPTTTSPAGQLLQAQWRRLGQGVVDTSIREFEIAQALQIQARGTFTYGVWGLSGAANDPDSWLSVLYHSNGSRNRMQLKDPKLDAMIDRQRATFDIQQRRAAIREIVVYMAENSPGVIFSNRYYLNAVKPKVREYAPEFHLNGRQYEWIWLDT